MRHWADMGSDTIILHGLCLTFRFIPNFSDVTDGKSSLYLLIKTSFMPKSKSMTTCVCIC